MAATYEWDESNGAGETITHNVTNANWKNIDDTTTAYTASPITAGNRSYDKFQFGHFSGTFNQISAGLYAHTAGTLGTGLTLKGVPTMTSDTTDIAYRTPATTANAALSQDITAAIAIGSGVAVWFGATSPTATGKAATMTTNPCYTNYLATQLETTGSAGAGDTATVTVNLRYDEN